MVRLHRCAGLSFLFLVAYAKISRVILYILIRYWWLRIGALAEAGEWMELEKFSRTKKPILGMEVSMI